MYANPFHWLHKSSADKAAMELFKTLVKLRIVDPIHHPGEWAKWYGELKVFASKYEYRN